MTDIVSIESGRVYVNGAHKPVKYASISAATSGNNTLVAAVTGKKLRVLSLTLVATTAVTVKFQSAAGGTDLTGAMPLGANGVLPMARNDDGHFETVAGQLLNLVLGGNVQVSGCLTYVEV